MNQRQRTPDQVGHAIYARTAAGGTEQIQTQVQAARAAIARDGRGGCAAIKEYIDVNVAGGSDGPGPGLYSLLVDAASGLFDVVVVTDVARLSRSAARLREILTAIDRGGTRVVCVEDAR